MLAISDLSAVCHAFDSRQRRPNERADCIKPLVTLAHHLSLLHTFRSALVTLLNSSWVRTGPVGEAASGACTWHFDVSGQTSSSCIAAFWFALVRLSGFLTILLKIFSLLRGPETPIAVFIDCLVTALSVLFSVWTRTAGFSSCFDKLAWMCHCAACDRLQSLLMGCADHGT